jgi:hypothetical protein
MADVQKTIEYVIKTVDDSTNTFKKISFNAGLMGAAIIGALGYATVQAREHVKNQAQLGAVLKSTGGVAGLTANDINRLSDQYAKLTNYSDDAIVSASNVLLTYTGLSEEVFPRALAATLDMASALDMNLNQAAERTGNILQYPSVALASLTRQGFRFTDQQKEMIEILEAAGDMVGAQEIIFGELELAYKGTAEAIRDPTTQLMNSLNQLAEVIGTKVLPRLNEVVDKIIPIVERMGIWIEQHPQLAEGIIMVIGALGLLLSAVGVAYPIFKSVAAALGLIKVAMSGVITVVGFLIATIGAPLLFALGSVIALIVVMSHHWYDLKGTVQYNVARIVEVVQGWVEAMMTSIRTFWQNMDNAWNNGILRIEELWQGALDAIKEAVPAPIAFIMDMFGKMFSWISDKLNSFISSAIEAGNRVKNVSQSMATRAAATKRSSGGTMTEPLTLVGEHGPELISAPGYKVHTAQETRAMGGGINLTVNVNGSLIGLGKRELAQMVGDQIMRQLRPVLA